MAKPIETINIDNFAKRYGDQVFEVVQRMKDGSYKTFAKVLLKDDSSEVKDAIQAAVKKIDVLSNKLNVVDELSKSVNLLNTLSTLNTIVGVANLCATVAGFAIVYNEMHKVSVKIDEVTHKMLDMHEEATFYKLDIVLNEYHNMLDCNKIGKEYTEEKYYDLISKEHALLNMLIKIFESNTCNNKNDILLAISSLSSMFAVTISNYDEIYYRNHKEKQKWHSSHEVWMAVYDELTSKRFIECLQDFMFIEGNYNSLTTDLFIKTVIENFNDAKQAILDKQMLIETTETKDKYQELISQINQSVINDIDNMLIETPLGQNEQVVAIVKNAKKDLELYS